MPIKLPEKKRRAVSYANMSQELQDAFNAKYPHGYSDYLGDILKVDRPNGDPFYAVPVETEDSIYLVKIEVKTDDKEDVENGLFKDMGDDEAATPEEEDIPDAEPAPPFATPEEEQDE
jgi:hypothetical protein